MGKNKFKLRDTWMGELQSMISKKKQKKMVRFKLNEMIWAAHGRVPSSGHPQVIVHGQISLHVVCFLDQNRQQIDTIQFKKRHCHRRCNFYPFFHDGVRICVSIFFLWCHRFPNCFFYVPQSLVKNGREAVYLSTPRLICSAHTHTQFICCCIRHCSCTHSFAI